MGENRERAHTGLYGPPGRSTAEGVGGTARGMDLLGFAQASSVGPKKALDICLLRVFTGIMGAMGVPLGMGTAKLAVTERARGRHLPRTACGSCGAGTADGERWPHCDTRVPD